MHVLQFANRLVPTMTGGPGMIHAICFVLASTIQCVFREEMTIRCVFVSQTTVQPLDQKLFNSTIQFLSIL